MNNIVIMGRLTRDPETIVTKNGKNMTRFTVAVSRRYKREGGPEADFFRCLAFGKTGEIIAKYLSKGRQICVNGEINMEDYITKDGEKRMGVTLAVNGFDFISEGKKTEKPTEEIDDDFYLLSDDDDVPF